MVDQLQANTNPDAGGQVAPMPSANQNPETQASDVVSPKGENTSTTNEPTLPDGAKERTTQEFEKLKTQLKEEKERRLQYERMFNQYPQYTPQPKTDFVDDPLEAQVSQLTQQNQQLSKITQTLMADRDERQARSAYKAHPQLDPNNGNFNEKFHNAVVGYLANAYARGQNISLKQAADEVIAVASGSVEEAKKQGEKEALERLTPKEQASLEASSRSDRRNEIQGLEDLRMRTRQGDKSAILERLKALPPIGR